MDRCITQASEKVPAGPAMSEAFFDGRRIAYTVVACRQTWPDLSGYDERRWFAMDFQGSAGIEISALGSSCRWASNASPQRHD